MPAPERKISFLTIVRVFITIPIFILLAFFYLSSKKESLPVYSSAPSFSMTERSGKTMTGADLRGKVWIADFIFTRCAGQCPIMSAQMKRLTGRLKKASFVSFSTDPEYDSPQVLSAYADGYEADAKQWFFLTGGKDALNAVLTGFKLSPLDDPMMHSTRFVLVDKKGQVRGFYDAEDAAQMNKLVKDAKVLL